MALHRTLLVLFVAAISTLQARETVDRDLWRSYAANVRGLSALHNKTLRATVSEEEMRAALPPQSDEGMESLRLLFISQQLSNARTLAFACELAVKHGAWRRGAVLTLHVLGAESEARPEQEYALLAELKQAQPQLQEANILLVGPALPESSVGAERYVIEGMACHVQRIKGYWHDHVREAAYHGMDIDMPDVVLALNSGVHSGSGDFRSGASTDLPEDEAYHMTQSWSETVQGLVHFGLFSVFTSLHKLEWQADVEVLREHKVQLLDVGLNPWQSMVEQQHKFPQGTLGVAFDSPIEVKEQEDADATEEVVASRNRYFIAFQGAELTEQSIDEL